VNMADAFAIAPPGLPGIDQVWQWLAQIEDPEIPVISIVDLGIVREVRWVDGDEGPECLVAITPTYSGCPATEVISDSIVAKLRAHGVPRVRLESRLSPAWTTAWLGDEAKAKLKAYGIAPPGVQMIPVTHIRRGPAVQPDVACPRCASRQVRLTSAFGSTPCKALYRCLDCLEPFDHFKCH
jgi:ring-1,2-phenylacetyl-CoA epoxidase subunit PaaD